MSLTRTCLIVNIARHQHYLFCFLRWCCQLLSSSVPFFLSFFSFSSSFFTTPELCFGQALLNLNHALAIVDASRSAVARRTNTAYTARIAASSCFRRTLGGSSEEHRVQILNDTGTPLPPPALFICCRRLRRTPARLFIASFISRYLVSFASFSAVVHCRERRRRTRTRTAR